MTFYLSIQSVLYSRFWKDLSEDSITSKFTFIQILNILKFIFCSRFLLFARFYHSKNSGSGSGTGRRILGTRPCGDWSFPTFSQRFDRKCQKPSALSNCCGFSWLDSLNSFVRLPLWIHSLIADANVHYLSCLASLKLQSLSLCFLLSIAQFRLSTAVLQLNLSTWRDMGWSSNHLCYRIKSYFYRSNPFRIVILRHFSLIRNRSVR